MLQGCHPGGRLRMRHVAHRRRVCAAIALRWRAPHRLGWGGVGKGQDSRARPETRRRLCGRDVRLIGADGAQSNHHEREILPCPMSRLSRATLLPTNGSAQITAGMEKWYDAVECPCARWMQSGPASCCSEKPKNQPISAKNRKSSNRRRGSVAKHDGRAVGLLRPAQDDDV